MRVYRFENEQQLGPFSGRGAHAYDDAQRAYSYHSAYDMPCLWDSRERGSEAHDHYENYGLGSLKFGFASLAQLEAAFPCAVGRAAMRTSGQRLVVYEVPAGAYFKGNAQVIFDPDRAERTGELDLKNAQTGGQRMRYARNRHMAEALIDINRVFGVAVVQKPFILPLKGRDAVLYHDAFCPCKADFPPAAWRATLTQDARI